MGGIHSKTLQVLVLCVIIYVISVMCWYSADKVDILPPLQLRWGQVKMYGLHTVCTPLKYILLSMNIYMSNSSVVYSLCTQVSPLWNKMIRNLGVHIKAMMCDRPTRDSKAAVYVLIRFAVECLLWSTSQRLNPSAFSAVSGRSEIHPNQPPQSGNEQAPTHSSVSDCTIFSKSPFLFSACVDMYASLRVLKHIKRRSHIRLRTFAISHDAIALICIFMPHSVLLAELWIARLPPARGLSCSPNMALWLCFRIMVEWMEECKNEDRRPLCLFGPLLF